MNNTRKIFIIIASVISLMCLIVLSTDYNRKVSEALYKARLEVEEQYPEKTGLGNIIENVRMTTSIAEEKYNLEFLQSMKQFRVMCLPLLFAPWYLLYSSKMPWNKKDRYSRNDETVDEKKRMSGEKGEASVREKLDKLDKKEYKILNNVIIPHQVHSQQIDHLVIGKNGIFHIETKNYGGHIIIDSKDNWKRPRYDGVEILESPVRQLLVHEKAISQLLRENFINKTELLGIVVLSNPTLEIEGRENCFAELVMIGELIDYIVKHKTDFELDSPTIDEIYDKLCKYEHEVPEENSITQKIEETVTRQNVENRLENRFWS